jgi:hypothetical protein
MNRLIFFFARSGLASSHTCIFVISPSMFTPG